MYIIHHSGEFTVCEKYEKLIESLATLCENYDLYSNCSSDVFSIVRNWEEFLYMAREGWQVNRVTNNISPEYLIQFNGEPIDENDKIIDDVKKQIATNKATRIRIEEEKRKKEADDAIEKLEKVERETYERLRAKYAPIATE